MTDILDPELLTDDDLVCILESLLARADAQLELDVVPVIEYNKVKHAIAGFLMIADLGARNVPGELRWRFLQHDEHVVR